MPTRHRCPICDAMPCDRHGMSWRHNPNTHYDGWERIHDGNKGEGRPVGGQWSKEVVRYIGGIKVRC